MLYGIQRHLDTVCGKKSTMFDPVDNRFYFYDSNRFVWNYKGLKYHQAEFKNGRAYLCDCMPAIRINGKMKLPVAKHKNASLLDVLHRQCVFHERMDQYYEKN